MAVQDRKKPAHTMGDDEPHVAEMIDPQPEPALEPPTQVDALWRQNLPSGVHFEQDFREDTGYSSAIFHRATMLTKAALLEVCHPGGAPKLDKLPEFDVMNRIQVIVQVLPPKRD